MGPADRRPRPDAPARGSRRGPRAAAAALPRRARVRAGHARIGPRISGLGRPLRCRRAAARAPVDRRSAQPRRDPFPRALAGCKSRPGAPARWRHIHQQRLHRAPRRVRDASIPARRRRRGGGRSGAARAGRSPGRSAQGRAPRLAYRDHAALPRSGPAARSRRVGGRREFLRPPRAIDHRSAPRAGRPNLSHRHRRHGRGRLRWLGDPGSIERAPGLAARSHAAYRKGRPALARREHRRPAPSSAAFRPRRWSPRRRRRPPRRRQHRGSRSDRPRPPPNPAIRSRHSCLCRIPRTATQPPSATIDPMEISRASATAPGRGIAPLAYFWGDDAYGLDAAVEAFRADPSRFPDGPPERWRPETDRGEPARLLGEIRERLGTGSMFGVGQRRDRARRGGADPEHRGSRRAPGCLDDGRAGERAGRARGDRLERQGAAEQDARRGDPARRAAVVRQLKAPREDGLASWIEARAREREHPPRAGCGAGACLARRRLRARGRCRTTAAGPDRRDAAGEARAPPCRGRAGDRRRREGARARGGAGFDVGVRRCRRHAPAQQGARAARAADRGPAGAGAARHAPSPHARADRGPGPARARRVAGVAGSLDAPRPFRAETLARQAKGWSGPELDAALDGLVELDAQVKGVGGRASTDARDRLSFDLWITDRVATG